MISQTQNRVQAIKSKFENLGSETPLIIKKNIKPQLNKHNIVLNEFVRNGTGNNDKENEFTDETNNISESESSDDWSPEPNMSYLYHKNDVKRSLSETKRLLTRQSSDPGKKLHRSHAFRCDRSQKIVSPKRHGSCNGRSETGDFSLKMEKKLSKDRLKRLGNLLEGQMRKENFVPIRNNEIVGETNYEVTHNSIPDSAVPQHILDQYAKVIKPKKNETDRQEKQDAMTDSGVSSETENLEEEKTGRIKKLMSQFEKTDNVPETATNLKSMTDLTISSDTIRLERKNPHLTLTDTLKKALKQPLPPGPPPKKPPRTFIASIPESPEKQKKDTKKMLEKLELVLQKREAQNQVKNEYDSVEITSVKKPKEVHYLCTEILDITQRTLLPNSNSNCFKSLNCAITANSTLSLPYTRFSNGFDCTFKCSSCNNDLSEESKRLSSFLDHKCKKCELNDKHDGFKCHLNCKCKAEKSEFFVDKEHIYDEPFTGDVGTLGRNVERKSNTYGTLNHSMSLEDLRVVTTDEDQKIYDIPCEISRSPTPEFATIKPKSEFERLRQNFETGFRDTEAKNQASVDPEKPEIRKFCTEKPPMRPKPVFIKNKLSKSIENIVDGATDADKKFATETRRYRKLRGATGVRMSLARKDNPQLDVDRENLNRLMNEIYETVTEACNMDDNKPGSFPTDQSDGSTSEDSVKLTRSLTEKRKNYVRRVSSRVAYLDPKNRKSTRFRHQTSICSYKSEIIDNPYSTFRSWKSFRASQNNLNKESKMADRSSIDSTFNLTDSKGNLLSMKNDFDSTDSIDMSIDEKTGCVDIDLAFDRERGLFSVCLLVGLNYMTGQAYVKSVFPSQVQVPPHIENLIFPETLSSASKGEWSAEAKGAQCYSLVLTDERGERSYGYCRRVLPEGASACLPLCYCLIGKYRAPGFYYKVLQEIESHHGSSDVEIHSVLQQLFETDFPLPGEEITITYSNKNNVFPNKTYRNSLNLGDILKCKTMPDLRHKTDKSEQFSDKSEQFSDKSESVSDKVPDFYDLENNNGPKKVLLSFEGPRIKTLKRPIEPRVDEDNLAVLVDSLGAGLTIKVFGSLLLERKVLIVGDKLSQVSSCMEALQSVLYPFVWQQPLISAIPAAIQRDVLEAPLPILAGMLRRARDGDALDALVEEGMLIDLTHPSKVLFYQGDESTILPTPSYKSLKTSLQMECKQKEDPKTRNVMISEAFLRFFVDILGDFWRFFAVGELKDGGLGKGDVVFDKDAFIKSSTTKQNQYFLEWFTETAMFNHFVQNMAVCYHSRLTSTVAPTTPTVTPTAPTVTPTALTVTPTALTVTPSSPTVMSTAPNFTRQTSNSTSTSSMSSDLQLMDTPLPNFYELFEDRVKSRSKTDGHKSSDGKSNYKNAVNKRVRLLKTKLKELVA